MKIAVIHNLAAGGARRRLSEQVSRLTGTVTEFCLSSAEPIDPDAVVVDYAERAPRLITALRPPARYLDFAQLMRSWRELSRLVERGAFDVIFANPCRFLQAPPPLSWTSRPSVYFCDEPRRVDHDERGASRRRGRSRFIYSELYRRQRCADSAAARSADRLLTNSQYTASAIRRAYGRAATVCPMGVPDGFCPSDVEAEHILSVGTLIPGKGHDLVLRSVAAAGAPWPVVVIGPREDAAESQRLRRLACDLGVALTIRTGVDERDLVDAYQRAVATLYLAEAEPLGLASLEAQACGSPVIVSAEGGLPETVVHDKTGWACPRVPAEVAALLERLRDSSLRRDLSGAAAAHGRAATWAASARAVEHCLEESCASR